MISKIKQRVKISQIFKNNSCNNNNNNNINKHHYLPLPNKNNPWLGFERILKYVVKDNVLNVVLDLLGVQCTRLNFIIR